MVLRAEGDWRLVEHRTVFVKNAGGMDERAAPCSRASACADARCALRMTRLQAASGYNPKPDWRLR